MRQLSFTIIHSTTIALPAWRQTCSELGLKVRLIPRDVVTRWNSTYDMMDFVLKNRRAIDQVTADKALKLRKYELDNDDWDIVEDLIAVLEVRHYHLTNYMHYLYYLIQTYKKATLYFSQDGASIAGVIPAMDKLDGHLNPRTKKQYHPAIRAAIRLARKKINRYYSLTDLSSVYRIAMGNLIIYLFVAILIPTHSTSPRPQTRVFLATELGGRVDRQCGRPCP